MVMGINKNIGLFKINRFHPCQWSLFFKYHLIKHFKRSWFECVIIYIMLPIFTKCMAESLRAIPCSDITLVATSIAKEKQSGHLTPWENCKMCTCNHAVTKTVWGEFWAFILRVFVYLSIFGFIIIECWYKFLYSCHRFNVCRSK